MSNEHSVVYRIDATDRLIELNAEWTEFAESNNGRGLSPANLIGVPLWNFIVDPTTRRLYEILLERVRHQAEPIRFDFRSDAPDHRRFLTMEIASEGGGVVQFTVIPRGEESRSPMLLLASGQARNRELITMCGWCNSFLIPSGEWVEVEIAVNALGLFNQSVLPAVSHGICPPCCDTMLAAAGDTAGTLYA